MHVQVSLIIEIEATAGITEMEQQIQEAGRQGMRAAFKQAIGLRPSLRPSINFPSLNLDFNLT